MRQKYYSAHIDELVNKTFTERERKLINQSCEYAKSDPAGLPGHNLMIIIEKLMRTINSFDDLYSTHNP